MGGYVGKGLFEFARDEDIGCVAVFAGTHESGVVNGALDNFIGAGLAADNAHVILHGWLAQGQVLSNEDSDTDAAEIEPIEKGVGGIQIVKPDRPAGVELSVGKGVPEFVGTPGHLDQNLGMTLVNGFEEFTEFLFDFGCVDSGGELNEIQE